MESELFASRLAARLRLPIAGIGIASLLLAGADLFFHAVDDRLMIVVAAVVGIAAVALFLCIVSDVRFQRAVSALNAERRAQTREKGRSSMTGWGLPIGDPLLAAVSLPLLPMCLVAANYFHRGPTTMLLLAAFGLVALAEMALMVRGRPPRPLG